MEEEIWKDIPDYEGYYQVSNLGRVRSLDRFVLNRGCMRLIPSRILKPSMRDGYFVLTISKESNKKGHSVHALVAMAFLNHRPDSHTLVVDHMDGDRTNNRLENIRIVTSRQNLSVCFRSNSKNFSSQYVGVCWDKDRNKWRSYININGRLKHLGLFNYEIDASYAYQKALKLYV